MDLRREIIEVGGTQYLFELRKKPKKKKEEKKPEPEPEEIVRDIPLPGSQEVGDLGKR